MGSLGGLEIVVIAIVALLVFGPKRLPEVSRQVGGALRELRRVQHQVKTEIDDALRVDDPPKRKPRAALDAPAGDSTAGARAESTAGARAESTAGARADSTADSPVAIESPATGPGDPPDGGSFS